MRKKVKREREEMNSDQFDREFDLDAMLKAWQTDPYTQELLSRLGSDYDENGIAYWEKND